MIHNVAELAELHTMLRQIAAYTRRDPDVAWAKARLASLDTKPLTRDDAIATIVIHERMFPPPMADMPGAFEGREPADAPRRMPVP
jgi:hypothetical protein